MLDKTQRNLQVSHDLDFLLLHVISTNNLKLQVEIIAEQMRVQL